MADEAGERTGVHVIVRGRVQGVGFRESCRRRAVGLGLAGSVRNLADGTVEAVFEGPSDAVDLAVDWCRRGPPQAAVTSIEASPHPLSGLTRFDVR
jgi:acylphosphatase